MVTSREVAEAEGLKVMATIKSYGWGGVDPAYMGIGPIAATKAALAKFDGKVTGTWSSSRPTRPLPPRPWR